MIMTNRVDRDSFSERRKRVQSPWLLRMVATLWGVGWSRNLSIVGNRSGDDSDVHLLYPSFLGLFSLVQ